MLEKAMKAYIDIDIDQMREPGFLEKRAHQIKRYVDAVTSGKGWVERHACPLCGHKARRILFSRYGVDIVQCSNCTVGYPVKAARDINDVLKTGTNIEVQRNYLDNAAYRKERFAKERLDIIARHLRVAPCRCRLLDVGCGTGWFLENAKEAGYKVSGQEIDAGQASSTSGRLGIGVFTGPFMKMPPKEKFDVITLFDVIEHTPDPAEIIKGIYMRLKKGGIALIFTPNLDSLVFWKLKEKSSLVMPVEHLFYFTEKSMRMLIGRTKLRVLNFETRGMDIPDIYSYYRDMTDKKGAAEFLREHCSVLQAIVDQAKCANSMRFVLKK